MKFLLKRLALVLIALVVLFLISKPVFSVEEENVCKDEEGNDICYKYSCYPIPGFDCMVTPIGGSSGTKCGQKVSCI